MQACRKMSATPISIALFVLIPTASWAQAAIPVQIATAKSVFVSNGGSEDNAIEEKAYRALCTGLQQWGKYRLASGPGEADIVFEFRYSAPTAAANVSNGTSYAMYIPRFQLILFDRSTKVVLWSVTEYPMQKRKTTQEQQNETAVNLLVDDLKALAAGEFPSVAAAAKKSSTSTKPILSQDKN